MIRKRRGWRPPWRQPPRPTGRRCPSPSIGWQSQAIRWSWTSPWRHPHHHPSPRRGCWRQISKCTQHVSKRYRLGSSTSCWRIPKLPRTNGPSLPSLSPQFVPWTTFAKQIWTPRRLSWIRWCSSHAPVVREERRRRRLVGKKKFLSNNELFFVFQPQQTNQLKIGWRRKSLLSHQVLVVFRPTLSFFPKSKEQRARKFRKRIRFNSKRRTKYIPRRWAANHQRFRLSYPWARWRSSPTPGTLATRWQTRRRRRCSVFFQFFAKAKNKRKQERAFQKRVMMVEREKFGEWKRPRRMLK